MADTNTNAGGYPATLVFDYLNNTLLGQLPSDLQSIIEPTRVISGYGCANFNYNWQVCNLDDNNGQNYISNYQKLYLLSGIEVLGNDGYGYGADTTSQLEYYQNESNIEAKQYNNTETYWWLRTAQTTTAPGFNTTNAIYLYRSASTGQYGVSPAFRIG